MQTEALVPLALPRGQKLRCELCLAPATVRCGACAVTFYCDVDHQSADWVSVHEKICPLLVPLRTAQRFYNSEKERRHGREQRISRETFLAQLTHDTAQNFLLEGRHEDAVPAALHSLKFSISVHGADSVELVPAYLVLAEASLGLGHLNQGEEYLSQAHWIILKNPHSSSVTQSKLHRNLGLLYAARGNFEDSLRHLANDVYYASCAFGTHGVEVAGGYFHMANVFFRQNRADIADSLFAEVVDIWFQHFQGLIDLRYQRLITPAVIDVLSEDEEVAEEALDEKEKAEAALMLSAILEVREQQARPAPAKMAKAVQAQAMLYYLTQDLPKAHECVARVKQLQAQVPRLEPDECLQRLTKLLRSSRVYGK